MIWSSILSWALSLMPVGLPTHSPPWKTQRATSTPMTGSNEGAQTSITVSMQGSSRVFLICVAPLETRLYLGPSGVWVMALMGYDGSSGLKSLLTL